VNNNDYPDYPNPKNEGWEEGEQVVGKTIKKMG
jgi:hypothetical protein